MSLTINLPDPATQPLIEEGSPWYIQIQNASVQELEVSIHANVQVPSGWTTPSAIGIANDDTFLVLLEYTDAQAPQGSTGNVTENLTFTDVFAEVEYVQVLIYTVEYGDGTSVSTNLQNASNKMKINAAVGAGNG